MIRIARPGSAPSADSIVDHDGKLTRWLENKKATVVAVRPDGFIYAAGGDTATAPAPGRPVRAGQPSEGPRMTTVESEYTIRANGADVFFAETGLPGRPSCCCTAVARERPVSS